MDKNKEYQDSKGYKDPDKPGRKPRKEDKLTEEQRKADEDRKERMDKAKDKYDRTVAGHDKNRYRDHNTPFLVIRYNTTDVGLRPIPGGTPHWASPDIWVESSSPLGNPVAGEQNFLHVRIYNFGAFDAMPVKVDFYWADPSLGLGPSNFNLIGTEYVEVKSMFSKVVRCRTPWIPVFVNNGHECVEVNCSCMPLDLIQHPFQPVVDRHVGQRNLHVEQAAPGQAFKFALQLNNVFGFALQNQITAKFDRLRIRREFMNIGGAEERDRKDTLNTLLNNAIFFNSPLNTAAEMRNRIKPRTPEYKTAQLLRRLVSRGKRKDVVMFDQVTSTQAIPKVNTHISDRSVTIFNGDSDRFFGERLVANNLLADKRRNKDFFVLQNVTLQPFEQRQMDFEVTIPGDARPGEIIIFHVAQETETLGIGGYAYAFLIR